MRYWGAPNVTAARAIVNAIDAALGARETLRWLDGPTFEVPRLTWSRAYAFSSGTAFGIPFRDRLRGVAGSGGVPAEGVSVERSPELVIGSQ